MIDISLDTMIEINNSNDSKQYILDFYSETKQSKEWTTMSYSEKEKYLDDELEKYMNNSFQ